MHPIERLRYVARAGAVNQAVLVTESASALSELGLDPQGLVTSCRRLIDKHTTAATLWWLSARILTALDPMAEAWRCVQELNDDPTSEELRFAIPDEARVLVLGWPEMVAEAVARRGDLEILAADASGEGSGLGRALRRVGSDATDIAPESLGAAAASADLVVLEATAIGPNGFLAVPGSRAAAATAYCEQVPVWVVGGVGRVLPDALWEALLSRRATERPWESDHDVVPVALVSAIVGPAGLLGVVEAVNNPDCPVAPELLRPTAM